MSNFQQYHHNYYVVLLKLYPFISLRLSLKQEEILQFDLFIQKLFIETFVINELSVIYQTPHICSNMVFFLSLCKHSHTLPYIVWKCLCCHPSYLCINITMANVCSNSMLLLGSIIKSSYQIYRFTRSSYSQLLVLTTLRVQMKCKGFICNA